ncbi:ABC transporter permease [Pseudonocardia pini]|uniref:ABC transporter permease n=1 Tax=Pseudonocardia pini TaxID=2758030 RepID=UPI0015F0F2F5|nr:ABC transporter permease [Pseudonocardia pini]
MNPRLRVVPLAVIALVGLAGPLVVPHDPETVVGPPSAAPGAAHWFGTDSAGMDVFSRTVAATGTDLLIGLSVMVVATALGIAFGLVVGMNEARDSWWATPTRGLARLVDLVQAVPFLIAVIVILSLYGTGLVAMIVVLSLLLSPVQFRLTRSEVLRVRGEAYLDAARQAGYSEVRLVVRHVLPNAVRPALENTTVMFGAAIIAVAGLGFLGVGLAPPTPEWGTMISTGAAEIMMGRWWSAVFPAAALAAAVAAVVFLSTALVGDDRVR